MLGRFRLPPPGARAGPISVEHLILLWLIRLGDAILLTCKIALPEWNKGYWAGTGWICGRSD
jgi:hypothetical protein